MVRKFKKTQGNVNTLRYGTKLYLYKLHSFSYPEHSSYMPNSAPVNTVRKLYSWVSRIAICLFTLSGCHTLKADDSNDNASNPSIIEGLLSGNNDDNKHDGYDKYDEYKEYNTTLLTDERRALLKAISVDEEAIEDGRLRHWQIEALNQLAYADEVLKKRYPSYSFKIDAILPKNVERQNTIISFAEDNHPDVFYQMEVQIEAGMEIREDIETGKTEIDTDLPKKYDKEDKKWEMYKEIDNFWTQALKGKYEDAIRQYLISEGIVSDRINVILSGLMDEEFSEDMDVNRILDGEFKPMQTIQIGLKEDHMPPSGFEEYAKEIQHAFEKKRLYGYFEVELLNSKEEKTGVPIEDTIVNDTDGNPTRYIFNTFQFR